MRRNLTKDGEPRERFPLNGLTGVGEGDADDDADAALRLQRPVDAAEVVRHELASDVLHHLNADNAVKLCRPRSRHGAVVDQVDADAVREPCSGDALLSQRLLIRRERESVDLDVRRSARLDGKLAPPTADLENALAVAQPKLGDDVSNLADLAFVQFIGWLALVCRGRALRRLGRRVLEPRELVFNYRGLDRISQVGVQFLKDRARVPALSMSDVERRNVLWLHTSYLQTGICEAMRHYAVSFEIVTRVANALLEHVVRDVIVGANIGACRGNEVGEARLGQVARYRGEKPRDARALDRRQLVAVRQEYLRRPLRTIRNVANMRTYPHYGTQVVTADLRVHSQGVIRTRRLPAAAAYITVLSGSQRNAR